MEKDSIEKILWSIAFPGFGQLLNKEFSKGVLLILLEIIVNIKANLNTAIILSFHGDILTSIQATNYKWLMFYPCLYFFAIWDAYRNAKGNVSTLSFLPLVFAAFFMTVGVIYSSTLKVFGVLFGPIFLPMLFVLPGLLTGLLVFKIFNHIMKRNLKLFN